MSILVRSIAWLLAAAVTFATLSPPGLRPHSDLGQDGEHALAFILVGLAFGLAYRRRRLLSATTAVVLIGVLELMQFWRPGGPPGWWISWSTRSPPASALRWRPQATGCSRAFAPDPP